MKIMPVRSSNLAWCSTQAYAAEQGTRVRAHAEAAGVRVRGAQRGALQRGQARADLHACVLHARVHLRRRRAHVVQHVDRQAARAAADLRADMAALSVQHCTLAK